MKAGDRYWSAVVRQSLTCGHPPRTSALTVSLSGQGQLVQYRTVVPIDDVGDGVFVCGGGCGKLGEQNWVESFDVGFCL